MTQGILERQHCAPRMPKQDAGFEFVLESHAIDVVEVGRERDILRAHVLR